MDEQKHILRTKMRGECYKLLASCFYLPQKELFLRDRIFDNLTIAMKEVCSPAVVLSTKIEEGFSLYSDEELKVEFARLFVGPFELKAPPYGSVYIDEGRRIMGDSTVEILKIYQQAGLTIRDEFKELPDHITVELEYMYYLIFKEAEAFEKSQQKEAIDSIKRQETFLKKFLGQWISPFCERINRGTANEFYRSLADCVLNFVTNDEECVNLYLVDRLLRSEEKA